MSHLNDPSLQPRKLEASENIFEIIMPWLPEFKQEAEALYKEKVGLGLIKDTSSKKAIKAAEKKKQSKLFNEKEEEEEKEKEKVQINLVTPEKSGNDEEKPKT